MTAMHPACRSTQQHWPFPDDKTMVGYAYIMTHPGIPCIFWVRAAASDTSHNPRGLNT
jgi:hypothetical protein